uniref:KH_dom_type_1 domain-containing protein n=1 Tax=Steinernema glaseri TaxID=37863 RepID=A0A1I8AJC5_9BILA
MDSVPYDFIERTILLAGPPNRSPFATLRGHWGRYTKVLEDETEHIHLYVDVHPDLQLSARVKYHHDCRFNPAYYWAIPMELGMEDLAQKNHVNIARVIVSGESDVFMDPMAEMIDDVKKEMLMRLLRHSNGLTTLDLFTLPKDVPTLTDLLEAIPRVENIMLGGLMTVEDVSFALSLMKNHVQRGCLKGLCFGMPISRAYFPLVRVFLEETEFHLFLGKVTSEDEDFAKEVILLIMASLMRRKQRFQNSEVVMRGSPRVLDVLKKEIRKVEESWSGKFAMPGVERGCSLVVSIQKRTNSPSVFCRTTVLSFSR